VLVCTRPCENSPTIALGANRASQTNAAVHGGRELDDPHPDSEGERHDGGRGRMVRDRRGHARRRRS
jgi:hypothetical protein